jgi:hypothetical protein
METEIPEELIEAKLALHAAEEEHKRCGEALAASERRYFAAMQRADRAWGEFHQQLNRQIAELAGPAEEGQ